ncbi:YicC/YloC family endoribonuclease [Thermoactinomyces sp. DSM 45891]|uniref:YicC/YloC family endoribonuclease n=1 Tax=Thermoactinomyces sp. DSM 45891 TaxID=1761907 RepID=UPI0009F3A154|nr:YicC/YloC family endoribonuclease [Thermoactinomyces sp. DSM 45891]
MKPIQTATSYTVSMTGFGRGEVATSNLQFITEIRTVNHRFLDLILRVPQGFAEQEESIRKQVRESIRRGRVELSIYIKEEGGSGKHVVLDEELLQSYLAISQKLCDEGMVTGSVTIQDVWKKHELWKMEETKRDWDEYGEWIRESIQQALTTLQEMRMLEGQALERDLLTMLTSFEETVGKIAELAPQATKHYRERLQNRLLELEMNMGDLEERLLTEVAIFAERTDITEEITRLVSHSQQFRGSFERDESIGRKLDFLIQEMNREMNTIGSKSNHAQIALWVVDCKSILEKMKEQVQNLE